MDGDKCMLQPKENVNPTMHEAGDDSKLFYTSNNVFKTPEKTCNARKLPEPTPSKEFYRIYFDNEENEENNEN